MTGGPRECAGARQACATVPYYRPHEPTLHPVIPHIIITAAAVTNQKRPCHHGQACRRRGCAYSHEQTSLVRLLQWLGAARESLDVAVFSITCDELADALLAAHGARRAVVLMMGCWAGT